MACIWSDGDVYSDGWSDGDVSYDRWIECHKEVYCVEIEHVEMMKFLHLYINNSYNHDMGGADIADQLCNYYRFDHWS